MLARLCCDPFLFKIVVACTQYGIAEIDRHHVIGLSVLVVSVFIRRKRTSTRIELELVLLVLLLVANSLIWSSHHQYFIQEVKCGIKSWG